MVQPPGTALVGKHTPFANVMFHCRHGILEEHNTWSTTCHEQRGTALIFIHTGLSCRNPERSRKRMWRRPCLRGGTNRKAKSGSGWPRGPGRGSRRSRSHNSRLPDGALARLRALQMRVNGAVPRKLRRPAEKCDPLLSRPVTLPWTFLGSAHIGICSFSVSCRSILYD